MQTNKIVGINGFGRIGRTFLRVALERKQFQVALINDLAPIETLAHLLKYDSVHGKAKFDYHISGNQLTLSTGEVLVFTQERNPQDIPWTKYGVQYVLESTGLFLTREKSAGHLQEGVKKVIFSAPPKDDTKTLVLGVNDDILMEEDLFISNASCTTNSAAPMVKVLKDMCNIESAYITTVHSYTTDQRLHDSPHSDLRRARAAALSIVPTTTGAAKALSKIFPELEGKVGGCGMRVPVPDGSLTDLTLIVTKAPSVEEINLAFKKASENEFKGIISYTDEPLVSIDIVGDKHSVIFDSQLTSVIGNMVKVVGWYDNEFGYSNRLVDLIERYA